MLRSAVLLKNLFKRLRAALTWSMMPVRVGVASRKLLRDYLAPTGWVRSIAEKRSVDLNGPVPWYTYPLLRVLPNLVKPDFRVFEYGCGGSTLWWAEHAREVVSVEHDTAWCQFVQDQAPLNVRLQEPNSEKNASLYGELQGFFDLRLKPASRGSPERDFEDGLIVEPFRSYAAEIFKYPDGYFDVVVVDGMARILTAWCALRRVQRKGFIIFDNADREEYKDAFRMLIEEGFARIDFWGFGPNKSKEWCSSVFTRNLDIFRG